VKTRRGFALIAALWLLVALSAVGVALASAGRSWRRGAIAVVDHQRATDAAEGGLAHVRARLEAPLVGVGERSGVSISELDPWREFERLVPERTALGQAFYVIRARDAASAINLNIASEEELRRLFRALRLDAGLADRLAQAIGDWKDADELHRARGAELQAYIAAGADVLPANAPFREVEELRFVRDVTPSVLVRVSPYLTVAGSGQINLLRADRAVLLALPGMSEELAALILRERRGSTRAIDLNRLVSQLSSSARALAVPHLPQLLARASSVTREIEVWSEGAAGVNARSTIHALLVRASGRTILVGRHAQ
jgi:general secretion pathway protein K